MRTIIPILTASLMPLTVIAEEVTYPIDGLFRQTYSGARTVLIPRFDPALGTLESATICYTPEFSGTVSGTANGPPDRPNGWVIEFSGTIRLTGPGFGNIDFGHFETRGGTVFQPGTPIFQAFGPQALGPGCQTFDTSLGTYTGTGTVSASLSWPSFTGYVFFSNGGSQGPVTRDLGAVGGTVTYEYTSISCPSDLDGDRSVGLGDLTILLSNFGTAEGEGEADGDSDGDGDVDLADLSTMLSRFGTTC